MASPAAAPATAAAAPSRWHRARASFRGLDLKDPASWPLVPRLGLLAGLALAVIVLAWFLLISDTADDLQAEQAQEARLKADVGQKLGQAVNLEALRKQREQVQYHVTRLEKQLPGRAEMDALLSDINQAGLGRGLHFDLFRPGQVSIRDYYAELPIALRVSGRYHDFGAFASDIANLSRIVTLGNLAVTPGRDGVLVMEATAKTFRYLDPEEVAAQRKAQAAGARK